MLTKQERKLVDYWKNWKPGKKAYAGDISEEEPTKVEVQVEVDLDKLGAELQDRLWDIL